MAKMNVKPAAAAGRITQWASSLWGALRDYFSSVGQQQNDPVNDFARLQHFVETRASYVAQTSLYGYLRTRAGMNYPTLFDDDNFVRAINIAKWHVWLACLSDLVVYAGGLLAQRSTTSTSEIGVAMQRLVATVLDHTGIPTDADDQFASHADRVRARVGRVDWAQVSDDEGPFSESPVALVRHAPIIDSLKTLDAEIVKNSVRFRWQEIRRDLRRLLDADAVLRSARTREATETAVSPN